MSFQDPPYYVCNNGEVFTCKMYGYLLIEVLCKRLRRVFYFIVYALGYKEMVLKHNKVKEQRIPVH